MERRRQKENSEGGVVLQEQGRNRTEKVFCHPTEVTSETVDSQEGPRSECTCIPLLAAQGPQTRACASPGSEHLPDPLVVISLCSC